MPTVIVSQRFNIRAVSNPAWIIIRFAVSEGEEIDIRMRLTSSASSPQAQAETAGRIHIC
jgi:hypothetical protein